MTKQKIMVVGNIGRTPAVTIGDAELSVIEYFGRRVVTLGQVDTVHKRPRGTARRNFNANRHRLIAGEDFFEIDQADEIRSLGLARPQGGISARVVLLSEFGYMTLVKSLNDDLAWTVQRQLVTNYFRHRQAPEPAPAISYSVDSRDTLTKAEQDQLRDALFAGANALPSEQQGTFLIRGWSKLKSHFKTGHYREIPRREFIEALSIIQRHVVEYQPTAPASQHVVIGHATNLQATIEGFASIASGLALMMPGLVAVLRDARGVQALTEPPARLTVKPASNASGTTKRKRA